MLLALLLDPCAAVPRTAVEPDVDRAGLIWPVPGSVTSRFGPRGLFGWHRGVDIKAPKGTPIRAAAGGTVVFSGRQSSYGRVIKIDHPNGLRTVYAHNSANFVKTGDRVKAGALIGAVGRTGRATTNHVHFELRRRDVARDPLPLLKRQPYGTILAKRHEVSKESSPRSLSSSPSRAPSRGDREAGRQERS
jgi:murein DD-endopeptidase MepM/ murein hydrolase activator NlpD